MLPVGADAAEGLDRPVDAADERLSVAVSSSSTRPAGLMTKTPATATARLLHRHHHARPRLAKENPHRGHRRIHGALATTGIAIAPASVWVISKCHGVEPSPRRSGPIWAEFLAARAKG